MRGDCMPTHESSGCCLDDDHVERKEYPQREIYMYGRYVMCQIMNWDDGPPPKYILCHALHPDYREPFFARLGMGTWMRADPFEIARELNRIAD